MSEKETVNVKELTNEISNLKKMVENLVKEPAAKGHVEELIGGNAPDVKAMMRKQFKEFLKNDEKKDWSPDEVRQSKKFKEAIGAVTATSAIPYVWSAEPEILSPEGADGYFLKSKVVQWKNDVKEKPGQITYVQTIGAVADAAITSGTEPTFTASTISSVAVTLTQRGHGFYISKADLEDVQDGTLDAMVEQSKKAVLRAVDAYYLQGIQAAANNAKAGTITEAGKMAATCLAKMWGSLMAGSYAPAAAIMHPVAYASLLQDSQFTNAATYGKTVVIETGKISQYIGMDIVPLVQGTLYDGAGTYRTFVLAEGAMAGALKREMDVEKQYNVPDQRNYNVVSIRFGGTVVHPNGIGLLLTVNG